MGEPTREGEPLGRLARGCGRGLWCRRFAGGRGGTRDDEARVGELADLPAGRLSHFVLLLRSGDELVAGLVEGGDLAVNRLDLVQGLSEVPDGVFLRGG